MENKTVKGILIGIGIFVVVLLVFQAGVFVGYKKAGFSDHLEFFHDSIPGGHGVTGKVIRIALPTIIMEGSDNIEKTILVASDTLVRQSRDSLTPSDIKTDDTIIVLGNPNESGQIIAQLVRIIPPGSPPPSTPLSTPN